MSKDKKLDLHTWTYGYDRGDWNKVLNDKKCKEVIKKISEKLENDREAGIKIFPRLKDTWRAIEYVQPKDVKVVMLGLDPYINDDAKCYYDFKLSGDIPQACGLSFSVRPGVKAPPSLLNIFKEMRAEGYTAPTDGSGCLRRWAKRGVLLLNTILTVEKGKTKSHMRLGWQDITRRILERVNAEDRKVAWVLLGRDARAYASMVTNKKHKVFETSHPSPLGVHAGFMGSGIFKKTAEYLGEFNWNL